MTLYLKYRPQTFDELDIESVRETLKKIVSNKPFPHAFLFYGPKGTGKTSAARILAKAINCEDRKNSIEPCNKCSSCISISKGNNVDVVELDAASHRGIDDIRSLREAVKLAPTGRGLKIYIIDEAHMLTTEASNALLKTLEEPPEHVVFILATTNPEKLIPTIRSRTTMISFAKATTDEFVRSLGKVAKAEGIEIDKEALEEISRFSDGSFRDAVKMFEQLISEKTELTPQAIRTKLSGTSEFDEVKFLDSLSELNLQKSLRLVDKSISAGASAKNITNALIQKLRSELISQITGGASTLKFTKSEILNLTGKLVKSLHDISVATIEQIPLELVIVDWCLNRGEAKNSDEKQEKKAEKIENDVGHKQIKSSVENVSEGKKKEQKEVEERVTIPSDSEISGDIWIDILSQIRQKNASTEALLRAAKPISFDGKSITLGVYYSFHKERLETNPHRILLEETLSKILGSSVRIVCKLAEPPVKNIVQETDIASLKPTIETVTSQKPADVILTEEKDDDIVRIAEKIFS